MFGLVDGNNFYASCERVFDPTLCGQTMVVLSNNDGCAIPRSDEAKALVRSMHRKGYAYKKAGVGLLDLTHGDTHQADLFASVDPRSEKLMAVLDQANRRFGQGTMGFASAHRRTPAQWRMRQEHLSPSYTTRWDELLKVR